MNSILKRVGYVLFAAVAGGIVGTIVVLLLTLLKAAIGSGRFVSPASAMILGFGLFGAISALIGAGLGKGAMAEQGQPPNRAADVAAWVVAIPIALLLVSLAFTH
jgi:hypothetical protein